MRKELTPDQKKMIVRLQDKIYSYSENARDEFDTIEMIEDNIREIFECDLECSTCTPDDRGHCMQAWKKANLYFLRKLYLDETKLVEFTESIKEMIDLVIETNKILIDNKGELQDETKEKYKNRFKEAKKHFEKTKVPGYYA